jgi:hypothetical protein
LKSSLGRVGCENRPESHRIEAALFAFKSRLSKGAILADEMRLGKTIEAGEEIIFSEYLEQWLGIQARDEP